MVELAELLGGAGKAELKSFRFAEPTVLLGFVDAHAEVVPDLDEAWPLCWFGPQHRAADAGVFVDAGGAERSGAGADGDFATLEVAEELFPFLVGGRAVFLGGA